MVAEMQIFVQCPARGILAVPASTDETLGHLKRRLLQSLGTSDSATDHLYFSHGGKIFPEETKLDNLDLAENSVLQLRVRVCGGGGDGGATGAESRDCYLKMYAGKKVDKIDPNETRLCKWTTCALSQETLKPPCVIDKLGNIFNKEALVRALLSKSVPPEFGHIRGLKDMVPVKLEPIKGVDVDSNDFVTKFQCPVTGLEFNGKYKFFALAKCGHVLSAKAFKELQSEKNSCLVCHVGFSENDKFPVNGGKEEVEALRVRIEEERSRKKGKANGKSSSGVEKNGDGVDVGVKRKVRGFPEEQLDAKQKAAVKKFKAVDLIPANADKEVFASIFTSSKKSEFKETYSCRSLPLGRN